MYNVSEKLISHVFKTKQMRTFSGHLSKLMGDSKYGKSVVQSCLCENNAEQINTAVYQYQYDHAIV